MSIERVNSQFAYETHQLMEDNSVRLSYSGDFSPDLITVLLLMAKSNIGGRSIMKKVYNIMIESLENITKHALKNEGDKYPATFVLGKDDTFYYLATGNKILNREIEALKFKLNKANSLEKKGLREWYNEILTNEKKFNLRNGAGLGIIDMAIKSGNKFEFYFEKIDDDNSFFTLKIKVKDAN